MNFHKIYIYTHIWDGARGATNQLSFLLDSISRIPNDPSIIFIEQFYNTFDVSNSRSNISDIIDLEKLNELFPQFILIDMFLFPNDLEITWGIPNNTFFHIGLDCLFYMLQRKSILNIIQQDPYPNQSKFFCIEIPSKNIKIYLKEFVGTICDIISLQNFSQLNIDRHIFQNIHFKLTFDDLDNQELQNKQCSVIHLRNEFDAIFWWSGMNRMNNNDFTNTLNSKYIHLITKYIPKTDAIIILTSNIHSNSVLNFLKDNNYNLYFTKKNQFREINCIHDLLFSEKYCNSILICPDKDCSSTFSRFLEIRLKYKTLVSFNLNTIHQSEIIVSH